MPPKPKYAREDVINAAYGLMERRGMDAVVAREVGKELGCTVAPIFTYFESMEELRAAVHEKAVMECTEYLRDFADYFPAFKEFGLRWVHLAQEHPHVYNEVFIRKKSDTLEGMFSDDFRKLLVPVRAEVVHTFSLSEEDADTLIRDMLIYAHGVATLHISGHSKMSEEDLQVSLSRMCLSYVAGCQICYGTANAEQLHLMLQHLDMVPRKKSEMGGNPFGTN